MRNQAISEAGKIFAGALLFMFVLHMQNHFVDTLEKNPILTNPEKDKLIFAYQLMAFIAKYCMLFPYIELNGRQLYRTLTGNLNAFPEQLDDDMNGYFLPTPLTIR